MGSYQHATGGAGLVIGKVSRWSLDADELPVNLEEKGDEDSNSGAIEL